VKREKLRFVSFLANPQNALAKENVDPG
jgi:hypothetical protein